MTWTDHRYEPEALPAADGVMIVAAAFVEDAHGRVLLQRDADDEYWTLPSGVQDTGERTRQAVVRSLGQLGIAVDVVGVVGIYRDDDAPVSGRHGRRCQRFSVCLRARPLDPDAALPRDARWIVPDELDALPIQEHIRARITSGFEHRADPDIEVRSPTRRWRPLRLRRRRADRPASSRHRD